MDKSRGAHSGWKTGSKRNNKDTHNPCNFIPNEAWRLSGVGAIHEKVLLESPGHDGEHEISSCLHALVANDLTPHLDGICGVAVLRC